MAHSDAICWERVILPSRYRYVDHLESVYWSQKVRWERRTLSTIGSFVPYHMCCCYNWRERGRDFLLVRIPPSLARFELYRGFRFEQGSIFSYK